VKKLSFWALFGAVAVALAGCHTGGGSSSGGNASIRLANATLTHPSLDLYVNASATASITAVATDTVSTYVSPASGSTTLQVNNAGTTTALVTAVPTLTSNDHYIVLAYESGGAVKLATLNEDYATPTAGTAQLRIYDLATDAGKVDIYITDPATDLATVTSPTLSMTPVALSSLLVYSPGTYRVRVTGYGNKNDLRIDVPSVTLTAQQIATVVLTPASGGVLLNGSTVIQQGTYAATRNTNARVRLAAAVSASGKVAASATSATGTITIDSGSVAPAFGYYALVPATSALNVTVNGNTVAAPTGLAAGSDQTLLVYGNVGTATATLLLDDNRLPADATSVKLRLINGVTTTTGALSLTANSALVASDVQPGTASSYVSVTGSTTAMDLRLTSSAVAGNFLTTSAVLNVKTVYSVLAGDDPTGVAKAQLLIR
jgi:hypothetical protein